MDEPPASLPPEALTYYARGREATRLGEGHGLIELARTCAEAPWQQGPGEIWRVPRDGPPALLLRGPMPAAIAVSAGGHLFVADRQGSELFALTPEGQRVPFLTYTQGDAPRGLAFAPDTSETRRAGIAGDLFVATINLGAWPVNEVVRISGPFDELIRQRAATSP